MKRYFEANIEDAERISIIECSHYGDEEQNDSEIYSGLGLGGRDDEINENDLPDDFANWRRYTAYAAGHCTVHVMSRDGG